MNKFLQKMAAACMAAAMVAGGTVSAFATDGTPNTIDTSNPVSLTIYKYDQTAAETAGVDISQFTATGDTDSSAGTTLADYALEGVEFTYLYVADITTTSSGGTVEVLYDLPTELDKILSLSTAAHNSDEINDALASYLDSDNASNTGDTQNVTAKNALENYVLSNGGTTITTNASGKASTGSLTQQGLYLVVETAVPENVYSTTDPFFVSLPMTDSTGDYWIYDVTVYPKNQTNNPTIDKVVMESSDGTYGDTATASEGDVLNYRIVSQLPSITSEATYLTEFTYVDTVDVGLSYNYDTYIAFYSTEDAAKNGGTAIETWPAGSANFNVGYSNSDKTMTVTMTSTGLAAINPEMSNMYIAVIYTATLNSDATTVLGDEGNSNTAALTYRRTHETSTNTVSDETIVYTYGIDLTKTYDGNTAFDYSEVQFILYNQTDGYYVTATGSNGVYYVTDGTQASSESDASTFTPADDGSLLINGLEEDTYVLTEIHTSSGYTLLKDAITIVINGTQDTIIPSEATVTGIENENEEIIVTNGDRASATVDASSASMSSDSSSTNARVVMTVLNNEGFTLPKTGGWGTIVCTVAGAVVVVAAICILFFNHKKKKSDDTENA